MKNYILVMALAAGLLTSCDPIKEEGTFDVNTVTDNSLLEGATFSQYNGVVGEDGNITYVPCEDGNYIMFNIPKVPAVEIYYIKPDGSEFVLVRGSSGGIFNYVPLRGSDSHQTLYFRYIDQDLKTIVASKDFVLQVAQELAPEVKLLVSNGGQKTWEWGPDADGRVWGNAGNSGGEWDGSSKWWGCGPIGGTCGDDFSGQMNHSSTGNVEETELGAYMVFNEDGSVKKFSKDGVELASGNFEIKDWTGGAQTNWVAGKLKVTNGAVLFPFMINSGGKVIEEFNISKLTTSELQLTYYETNPGEWGETTWWSFKSGSDYEGILTNNDTQAWTWGADDSGRCWGNAGNAGGTWDGSSKWWGCGPIGGACGDDFSGQMGHSGTGNVEETMAGAYMVFGVDGTITKYSADGNKFGEGRYEVKDFTTVQTNFNQGTLHVTGDGILFPFMINSGGKQVTDFNISGLSGDKLELTYYETNPGEWGEVTWWLFTPKK